MNRFLSLILLCVFVLFSACQTASAPASTPVAGTETSPTVRPLTATIASPTSTPTPTEIPPTPTREPLPPLPEGFVHAQGRNLVIGESQTPIRLTGVNFPAYGWGWGGDTPKDVYKAKDFRQIDYFRVADMGMNIVRLNIWYQLFEHDYYPYVYDKPEGWDWLNQQIEWAREARVYIILSMMRPQGEYQGPDYAGRFWEEDPYYRDRLKALWVEIAARYKDETQIAAFDLLNEPWTNERNDLWVAYAQELVNAIRAVDENHLLDIQQDLSTATPFLVKDPVQNVMYDFHFYEPYYYTTQFVRRGWQGKYGDPLTPIMPWDWELEFSDPLAPPVVPVGDSDWAQYETERFTPPPGTVGAQVVFLPPDEGRLFFDAFEVLEYAPDGTASVLMTVEIEGREPTQTYPSDSPFTLYAWNFLPLDESGAQAQIPYDIIAKSGYGSLYFSTPFGAPRLIFPIRQGYAYSIKGWMKGEGVNGAGGFTLRWADWMYGDMTPLTKESLEKRLLDPESDYNLQFYLDANVPVNVGEWGLSPFAFTPQRGGLEYVRDVLGLFEKYNLNSQYWVYSRFVNYFIYKNAGLGYYAWPSPENANQPLVDLFTEILHK